MLSITSLNFNDLSVTSINFNDLPEEVHKTFFDLFNPIERTLVLPTCKKWHDLIIETTAWWKEVEIDDENTSMEKIKTILQIFSTRSGNALTKVRINRRIGTQEELQEIFSSIQSSVHSLKIFVIRQRNRFNTLTRRFARSMPQLQVFCSTEEDVLDVSIRNNRIPLDKHSDLWFFKTDILDDLQKDEINWLSHLRHFIFEAARSRKDLISLLKACGDNLERLTTGFYGPGENQLEWDQITLNALSTLHLQDWGSDDPVSRLSFKTPALTALCCRLEDVQKVEFLSLEVMKLILEDEGKNQWLDEGEGVGEEQQGNQFVESFQSTFRQMASISGLILTGVSSNLQVQLQSILQTLSVCLEADSKEVLLPSLTHLYIYGVDQSYDFEQLARVAIRRGRFLSLCDEKNSAQNDERENDVDLDLGENIADPEERKKFLLERINLLEETNTELRKQVMEQYFRVETFPTDFSLKDQMMEKFLETKKRMRGVEFEQ